MSLIDALNKELNAFNIEASYRYNAPPPKVILVNPDTLPKLVAEWKAFYKKDFLNCQKICIYMGIPVYRSPDIEENKFLIL